MKFRFKLRSILKFPRIIPVFLLICVVAIFIIGLQSQEEPYEQPIMEFIIEDKSLIDPPPVFYLSGYERRVAECIVMGESEGEPYEGQVLVAQCLLNACLKDDLQPSEVRKKYKYSGWKNNPSESVKDAVSAVFDDGYKATEKFVLYFYAPRWSKGEWHETQNFVIEVGGHRFFSEK